MSSVPNLNKSLSELQQSGSVISPSPRSPLKGKLTGQTIGGMLEHKQALNETSITTKIILIELCETYIYRSEFAFTAALVVVATGGFFAVMHVIVNMNIGAPALYGFFSPSAYRSYIGFISSEALLLGVMYYYQKQADLLKLDKLGQADVDQIIKHSKGLVTQHKKFQKLLLGTDPEPEPKEQVTQAVEGAMRVLEDNVIGQMKNLMGNMRESSKKGAQPMSESFMTDQLSQIVAEQVAAANARVRREMEKQMEKQIEDIHNTYDPKRIVRGHMFEDAEFIEAERTGSVDGGGKPGRSRRRTDYTGCTTATSKTVPVARMRMGADETEWKIEGWEEVSVTQLIDSEDDGRCSPYSEGGRSEVERVQSLFNGNDPEVTARLQEAANLAMPSAKTEKNGDKTLRLGCSGGAGDSNRVVTIFPVFELSVQGQVPRGSEEAEGES